MWREKKTVLHVFVLIVIFRRGGLLRAKNHRLVWVWGLGLLLFFIFIFFLFLLFFVPSKKLKYFCGIGLCFDKPSLTLSYEADFHSEDFCPC